ncbi:tetratricopeptide repeat protein [Formosa sp. S-31]|uniref:tetratricopeptide repeat protein n=1 Tax=Formosa sp. S-31 TaxID=2790949 RepID=UPI003EC00F44
MITFKLSRPSFRIKHHPSYFNLLLIALSFGFPVYLNAQQNPYHLKRIDSVFTELKNRLNKAETKSNKLDLVNSHIQLAHFYETLGIDNEAIKHYHDALEYHPEKDTTSVFISNKIGAIHLDLKQYENALHYVNRSLNIAEQIHFKKGKAQCYALLGSIAEKESDYTQALQYQNQSLNLFKILIDSTGLATTYENIGSIYEDLKQYEQALNYFTKANAFAKHSPSDLRLNILNNQGDAYRKMGQFNKALPYTQLAYSGSKITKNIHQEASALKDLALNYAGLGDFKTAFDYMKAHLSLNSNEIEQQNAELVSTLQILYEVEEREAQMQLLNKQNQLNTIKQNIILLSGSFLILLLVTCILYLRKRKRQESKIQHYKNELLQANLEKKTQEEVALQREIDIKISALTNYSLHLAHKNKMISDISRTLTNLKDRNPIMIKSQMETLVKEIDSDLSQEEEWTEFISFFEQIHPNFFHGLKHSVTGNLSPSELRLCMLLRLNLSSKEIASILRITPDSVRIARYRLRKKLPVNEKEDLQVFLLNL